MSVPEIIKELWWDADEPSEPDRQARVVMYRTKKKLASICIKVQSGHYKGYWLDEAVRKDLRQRIGLQERP